ESNELIATLWRSKDETSLGAYGHWLMAKAYQELGFWDQSEKLLRRALPHAQPPFNAGIEITLAETLLKKNLRADATTFFEKWAASDSPFRSRARLHLARIEFNDKHFTACADWCQKMWTDRDFQEPGELFVLWGSALEGAGEYAKAAQCFAGK